MTLVLDYGLGVPNHNAQLVNNRVAIRGSKQETPEFPPKLNLTKNPYTSGKLRPLPNAAPIRKRRGQVLNREFS